VGDAVALEVDAAQCSVFRRAPAGAISPSPTDGVEQ